MSPAEHYPVVVIGAGQAGLCASYWLRQRGIHHVVLEKREVAYAWKHERWDSFCLVTPNWQCQLSGFPYRGPEPRGFMVKAEIVQYLEEYCRWVDPPLRIGVEVTAVVPRCDGGFDVATSSGQIVAECVVVCVGPYHTPVLPDCSGKLPASVTQLHSRDYRSPAQLPEGAVLVVGSGQSGCQIAEDLHLDGRQVHLCLGDAPRSPRVYRGKDVVEWLEAMGYYDLPVEAHPDVDATRDKTNHYLTGRDGGREIDLRRLALQGMRLYGYLQGVDGTVCRVSPDVARRLDAADAVYNGIRAMIDKYVAEREISAPVEDPYVPPWTPQKSTTTCDLAAEGITSVIWSIGFRSDFSMIRAPSFDAKGVVRHRRGVTATPGLYVLGLPWLHTWGSARMSAVGRDADHVVQHIGHYLTLRASSSPQLDSQPFHATSGR